MQSRAGCHPRPGTEGGVHWGPGGRTGQLRPEPSPPGNTAGPWKEHRQPSEVGGPQDVTVSEPPFLCLWKRNNIPGVGGTGSSNERCQGNAEPAAWYTQALTEPRGPLPSGGWVHFQREPAALLDGSGCGPGKDGARVQGVARTLGLARWTPSERTDSSHLSSTCTFTVPGLS